MFPAIFFRQNQQLIHLNEARGQQKTIFYLENKFVVQNTTKKESGKSIFCFIFMRNFYT